MQERNRTVQVKTFHGTKLISTRDFHPSRMDLAEWHATHIVKMGFTAELVVREYPSNSVPN